MKLPVLISVCFAVSLALPVTEDSECQLITGPVSFPFTGVPTAIPDADHPYIAPGPGDQRGPCPGMNTLANHGYIPRNGIASFEQIVAAAQEGLGFDVNVATRATATALLARGNPFINRLSIGGVSNLVPVLPGQLDGPAAPGGLSKHGRFEGDDSISRDDFGITGDDHTFSPSRFSMLIEQTKLFGNGTVVNLRVIQETKRRNFQASQTQNKNFQITFGRRVTTYLAPAAVLLNFVNATAGITTLDTATSFFKDNRFPPNWFRVGSGTTTATIAAVAASIQAPYTIPVGHNENGNWVFDDYQSSDIPACDVYAAFLSTVPKSFATATGCFKQNIDFLISASKNAGAAACPDGPPTGAVGV